MPTAIDGKKLKKVLCIDDDPDTLTFYKKHIASGQYNLITEHTIEEGLETAIRTVPDLIICSAAAGGQSGMDFCRAVRSEKVLALSAVILAADMTLYESAVEKGPGAGCDEVILKPFSKALLRYRVEAAMRTQALRADYCGLKWELARKEKKLEKYRASLEKKNEDTRTEKDVLENSLKQIALLTEEKNRADREVERLEGVIRDSTERLVEILSSAIESRLQNCRGHSGRVAEIAAFLGKEMALPEENMVALQRAALLHEIGKLSVSDELAVKRPEKYTDDERNFLIQHPVSGADLLKKFPGFGRVSKIIRHFHEFFDGRGVPSGYSRQQIPLESRILAVANMFVAISGRPGKSSQTRIMEIMDDFSGTRYDPHVIYYLHRYIVSNSLYSSLETKETGIYELAPGMTLASGLYTRKGAHLLPKDTVLTEESIRQIANYNKIDPLEETVFIKEQEE